MLIVVIMSEYNESVNWSELFKEYYYQPDGSNTESYITTQNCIDMIDNQLPEHLLNQIQELKIIIILLILIIIFLVKDNIITEIKKIIKNKF